MARDDDRRERPSYREMDRARDRGGRRERLNPLDDMAGPKRQGGTAAYRQYKSKLERLFSIK